jgi:peptide/nickel transport system permease protein
MTNYLIRRAFQMMIVVLLATFAIYLLLNIAPGGPLAGLKLAADVKSRVSEADIARLEAYLGLDKPLAMRYLLWLVGDDWLGSDWVYVGLTQFKTPKLGRDGTPIIKIDRGTGEQYYQYEKHRFWADPGIALLNPGYPVWVYGEQVAPGEFTAMDVVVKPPTDMDPPPEVVLTGKVLEQEGYNLTVESLNGDLSMVSTSEETAWNFPPGEARPRPEEGTWVNVSWLFGPGGLLGKYAGYHADNQGILRFDFGWSWKLAPGQPVSDLIASRLGNTIVLMTTAIVLSLLIGIPIGVYSAVHQYSKTDYVATTFAFFGSAMPIFWFGLMLILVFSYSFKSWGLPYMPSGGVASVRMPPDGSFLDLINATPGSLVDRVVHIILPAIMLGLLYMAGWSRYSRSSMLEVLRQDYVRTARAKGLMERVVVIKHALRNALIPVVTILVFDIAGIFSGAILTETIFSYPGMGRLYFDALGASDWPVMMAFLFISAILVVIATLVRDILYTIVDPRIRFS